MAGLEDAIELAVKAHRGQRDKGGSPYVLHPLRMMLRMGSELEMMAAILHDVVEDTQVALSDLEAAGYPREAIDAVEALTRRPGESYDAFIDRVKRNPIARAVKLADLEDNMDLRRIPEPEEKDFERLRKYRAAWSRLRMP